MDKDRPKSPFFERQAAKGKTTGSQTMESQDAGGKATARSPHGAAKGPLGTAKARLEREAAALRANLGRRKAQARAQEGLPPKPAVDASPKD